jgi:hypothetical protein
MKAFTLLAMVASAFAEELLARGGGGGGDWGYGDKTTKVVYTTSTYDTISFFFFPSPTLRIPGCLVCPDGNTPSSPAKIIHTPYVAPAMSIHFFELLST